MKKNGGDARGRKKPTHFGTVRIRKVRQWVWLVALCTVMLALAGYNWSEFIQFSRNPPGGVANIDGFALLAVALYLTATYIPVTVICFAAYIRTRKAATLDELSRLIQPNRVGYVGNDGYSVRAGRVLFGEYIAFKSILIITTAVVSVSYWTAAAVWFFGCL